MANNGIGAVKFIRSVRSWAYKTFGSERAVSLVAMATPEASMHHNIGLWGVCLGSRGGRGEGAGRQAGQ